MFPMHIQLSFSSQSTLTNDWNILGCKISAFLSINLHLLLIAIFVNRREGKRKQRDIPQ